MLGHGYGQSIGLGLGLLDEMTVRIYGSVRVSSGGSCRDGEHSGEGQVSEEGQVRIGRALMSSGVADERRALSVVGRRSSDDVDADTIFRARLHSPPPSTIYRRQGSRPSSYVHAASTSAADAHNFVVSIER